MNLQNFKSDSYCVGGRHRSDIKNIRGFMTSICSKVLFGYCSFCNRKYSMTGCDNTIHAEGLGQFFKKFCKKGFNVSEKDGEIRFEESWTSFGNRIKCW